MSSESAGADLSQVQAETNSAPSPEKMLPQSQVTELVANARAVAAAKAREEMEAQFARERESLMSQRSMGGMGQPQQQAPQLDTQVSEAVKREMEAQRQLVLQQQYAQQVNQLAEQYSKKMEQGEAMYPDFKQVTSKYNPASKANSKITLMLATLDNAPEVLYDMMKNPTKLTHIRGLLADDDDQGEAFAYDELKSLAESIRRNKDAADSYQRQPSPLSKPKASIAGADSGKRTIADWKKVWKA